MNTVALVVAPTAVLAHSRMFVYVYMRDTQVDKEGGVKSFSEVAMPCDVPTGGVDTFSFVTSPASKFRLFLLFLKTTTAKTYFYVVCMSVCLCVCLCTICVPGAEETRRGSRTPKTGVTDSCVIT